MTSATFPKLQTRPKPSGHSVDIGVPHGSLTPLAASTVVEKRLLINGAPSGVPIFRELEGRNKADGTRVIKVCRTWSIGEPFRLSWTAAKNSEPRSILGQASDTIVQDNVNHFSVWPTAQVEKFPEVIFANRWDPFPNQKPGLLREGNQTFDVYTVPEGRTFLLYQGSPEKQGQRLYLLTPGVYLIYNAVMERIEKVYS